MDGPNSERLGLTRRRLLQGAVAATPALALAAQPGTLLAARRRADPVRLEGRRWLRERVREMVELGPRLTATGPHRQFIDGLDEGFRRAGLTVERDPHPFERWLADRYALEVLDGPDPGVVPVASYYTYSGRTPPEGVVGDLVSVSLPPLTGDLPTEAGGGAELTAAIGAALAGVAGGVAGKIVVIDAPILPLTVGVFDALLTYRHDPDGTIGGDDDYKRAWTTLLTLPSLDAFRALGAAGVVFVLDASPANAKGQYTPFVHGYQDMPALIVDREAGARLRRQAAGTPRIRLVLDARLATASSDTLVATLPGGDLAEEVVIVNTHTDGQNAFEENAGVASVALARYFAGLHKSRRRRTIVFSCTTGHFSGGGQPETEGFIEDHHDVIERAAAAVTIEHFGAREWNDDASGYHATGLPELGAIFHTVSGISEPAIESLKAKDLRRTELLKPIGPIFFGVGRSLHAAGVPSVAYIAGPNYLLALEGKRGHLDKFSSRRMAKETRWTADLLHRLDALPREALS